MEIIVIGGCHTYGYGIEQEKGFVPQWARQIGQRFDEPVNITYYAPAKLTKAIAVVQKQSEALRQATLIILQVGNFELSWRSSFWHLIQGSERLHEQVYKVRKGEAESLKSSDIRQLHQEMSRQPDGQPRQPLTVKNRIKNKGKLLLLNSYRLATGELPYLRLFKEQLQLLLNALQPYRHKALIMTPFASCDPLDQWLRKTARPLVEQAVVDNGCQCMDTFQLIPPRSDLFLPDSFHLNEKAHSILGDSLLTVSVEILEQNSVAS